MPSVSRPHCGDVSPGARSTDAGPPTDLARSLAVHTFVQCDRRELLVRCLFLVEVGIQQTNDVVVTHRLSPGNEGAVAGDFVVLYAGAHGPANALDGVLDAAGRLQRRRPGGFRFVLVGDGHDKPRLRTRAESEGLGSVVFLDPVPKAEVYGLMAGADALIVNMNRGNLYRFGISFNKL